MSDTQDLTGLGKPARPGPLIIRTPDQRLRVFVSSTLQELADERAAAREAITRLRLAPVMFELGARPHPPRDLYRAYLEQSHIFIGLYWQRYGWVAPGMDISGLEDEYRLSGQKPKLIYIKAPAPEREPRLKELLDRIRSDDTASYKSFSTPAELRDLIENDLALLLTERFEMAQPGEETTATTSERRRTNLPTQPTAFIGREKEVTGVRDLLLRQDVRLVTLTGPGGVGKSRLGLQVAADQIDSFKDGVFFVPLSAISEPGLVPTAIAQTLGVQQAGGKSLLDSLRDYLRDKQILLLLDNFEQVISAAPLVADLLETSPHAKLLVTSRAALHIYGEYEFSVLPLALPDPKRLPPLEDLTRVEAIRLFIERVRAVKSDFAVTPDNAPAIVEICRRLDGLPLAIELAAARIKLFPPQALLARLQSRLKMLTGGARDLPARQQTLRDTITWSYDLLDEGEKTLFRRLSIFVGGSTLEAAEAVCDATVLGIDLLDGLASLVDKSLLRQVEGADGEPRFVMLETIREYGLEQLAASGEAPTLRRRHADFFLALAEAAEPKLTSAERGIWLERLESEYDNLRAALEWSRADASASETGLRLVGALIWFWYLRGYWSEGCGCVEGALALTGASERTAARAKALYGAGVLAWLQGDHALARSRVMESVGIFREVGSKRDLAYALSLLGVVALSQGDYTAAPSPAAEGVALFRQMGDRWGLAVALNNVGNVASQQGDYAGAQSYYEESLALFQELEDKWGQALPLRNLGQIALRQGDYTTARSRLEESLVMWQEVGDQWRIALSLNDLGDVARLEGDYKRAAVLYDQALSLERELGSKENSARSLHSLGYTARVQGDYRRAVELLQQSLALHRELENRRGTAECLAGLTSVMAVRDRPERAARLFGAVEALFKATGAVMSPADRADYEHTLAAVRAQLGEEAFAAACAEGRTMTLEQAVEYANHVD